MMVMMMRGDVDTPLNWRSHHKKDERVRIAKLVLRLKLSISNLAIHTSLQSTEYYFGVLYYIS